MAVWAAECTGCNDSLRIFDTQIEAERHGESHKGRMCFPDAWRMDVPEKQPPRKDEPHG